MYGSLFLLGIIFFSIQSAHYNSLTGGVVGPIPEEYIEQGNEDLNVGFALDRYEVNGDLVKVSYYLREDLGRTRNIDVDYALVDSFGNKMGSGKSSFVLGKNMLSKYTSTIVVSNFKEGDIRFVMKLTEGDSVQRVNVPLFFSAGVLTGSVIGEHRTIKSSSYFIAFLVLLIVIFYCLKMIHTNMEVRKLRVSARDRLIPIQ